jgi:hypothetical protein
MDRSKQRDRIARWLRRAALILSLVASCGVRATPLCINWRSGELPINDKGYPTQVQLGQAVINYFNSWYHYSFTLTSCDGVNTCYYDYGNIHGASFAAVCVEYGTLLSISIQPAPTSNGVYSILPSSTLPLEAVVKDQAGVVQANKMVSLTVSVQTGTSGVPNGNGGHIHTDNRTPGILSCSTDGPGTQNSCALASDSSGSVPFLFIASPVSGSHTIRATCDGCGNTATAVVNVKVDNLIEIPTSPQLYALQDSSGKIIGAIPGMHTGNHYLTATAIDELKSLAILYTTRINPNAVLYLNDASLVWGGLFDVDSSKPWSSPHTLHDRGLSLDIRAANSGPNNEGTVPVSLFIKFMNEAKKLGFRIGLHCKNSSDTHYCLGQPNNRHFHIDF